MKKTKIRNSRGYSMVAILVISVIGIIISTALIMTVIINSQNASKMEQGFQALATAESSAENAILKLLRDPYYSGESMTIGNGSAVVTVTGITTKTITSTATYNNFVRTVEIQATYNQGILAIDSWKEL